MGIKDTFFLFNLGFPPSLTLSQAVAAASKERKVSHSIKILCFGRMNLLYDAFISFSFYSSRRLFLAFTKSNLILCG